MLKVCGSFQIFFPPSRYKSFKVSEDDDETSGKGEEMTRNNDGLKKKGYWYDYYNLF